MPYTFSATARRYPVAGRNHYELTVVELAVADANSEWSIADTGAILDSAGRACPPPKIGRVSHVTCTRSGGAATTVDPQAGSATTAKDIYENGTAAAAVRFAPSGAFYNTTALYGSSKADGTVTTCTTVITIVEGHQS